jgi:trans-aconitate methyltransferase
MLKDPYYATHLPRRYNPKKWDGDSFQENARLEDIYERVNALNPTLVIDAGCGRNNHKSHIKNLVGFDASPFPEVDHCCPISEAPFAPQSADAVLCLGSVQFISRDYIKENMDRIVSWVKPGGLIEMRVMMVDEFTKEYWATFDPRTVKVPWDKELRDEITAKHNLEYAVDPWVYRAELLPDGIIRRSKSPERLEKRQQLERECWTWRKPV